MDFKELFSTSVEALKLNKTRTALATLGIIIGIAAVITLLSLGQASQKAVESQIQALGSNLLTVISGSFRPGDFRSTSGTATTLTLDDAKAILTSPRVTGVKNVSAEIQRREAVTTGRESVNTTIIGVLPSYREVRSLEMALGRFLTEGDNSSQAKVAVLGPTVVENLFGQDSAIGKSIRINKVAFTVI